MSIPGPSTSQASGPPGATGEVEASRVLVLAPHHDDEVLGCGGLLARLTAAGAAVRVLFLSDSAGGVDEAVDDPAAYAAARREEAEAAASCLGIADLEHLDLPDGALDQHLEAVVEKLRATLPAFRPDLLLVPSPLERSADHRAAFRAVHETLGAVREGDALHEVAAALRVLAYEVNRPLDPDLLIDVGAQLPALERAVACYESQEARHPYARARRGLLRYRSHSLPPEVEAAEAYRRLELADFTTRSPAGLARALGAAPALAEVTSGPRLSVVVRTRDRPQLLAEALASLAASTYRRAEVVVVNDGGAPPALPAEHPLGIETVHLEPGRGRAAAANAGVDAATGDAVVFLDDDDLVEPEHLATLAGLLGAAGVRVAYTDAAVGVYELAGDGWTCRERRLPYSRDFDPDLLLFDNYIPFNTPVIERALFAEVGPFDESLPFFEDWDWLIRCAAVTPFHHHARVTCEYRQFRGAGHHVLGDRPRSRNADFLAMKSRVIAKHAARATPEAIAAAVDRLRAEAVAAREDAAARRRAVAEQEERAHRLNGRLEGARAELAALEIVRQRVAAELTSREAEIRGRDVELGRLQAEIEVRDRELGARDHDLERLYGRERELVAAIEEQGAQLAATYAEIERLNGLIRGMESTRAWRVHSWWQARRG